ncbi:MAG: phospholipid carrier-dependent glycosyltransferase, partial [Leptolyngbyaceae cyanobacterium bins.59]|nr:phospholipid carrier-dependent glycosyltransferase [Leptolyngbyaceae cyanobacterium bins.59]
SAVGIGLLAIITKFLNRTASFSLRTAVNTHQSGWGWLLGFCLGTYGVCSLATNKDIRFFLPCVPVLILLLTWGFVQFSSRWFASLRWTAVTAAIGWLAFNLIPLPAPSGFGGWHLLSFRPQFPTEQVIQKIVANEPFLQSTLGMLVDFKHLNAFNIDFYGALANFQVYGRQLALNKEFLPQDARSLSWYLTKTGPQGSFTGNEAIATLRNLVEQSPELEKVHTWPLDDSSELLLYHRRTPAVIVQPLPKPSDDRIRLESVQVPNEIPPGQPVPVTYKLSGSQEAMQNGLLILTWQHSDQPQALWFHDHGIGLGQLRTLNTKTSDYRVIENLAMLPPANLSPGRYTLKATYVNRQTGESLPLSVPLVELMLNPQAQAQPAPELDLMTQLRQLAATLPEGKLDPVFNQVGRINQYDPTQDYLLQAERILAYRLQQDSTDLPSVYTLALANILRRQAIPAIDTLTQITHLDRTNPYAWAYLAFVHLYRWHPNQAEKALKQVEALNPQLPELRTLQIATAIMKLNIPLAWKLLHTPVS